MSTSFHEAFSRWIDGNSADKLRHPRADATDLVWRNLSALLAD